MIIPTQPNFNVVNTADYRETYANSVQVRVNVWDFFLVFGTMQQQTENQVEVRNFQGIYLSPQQAKALAAILNRMGPTKKAPSARSSLIRAPPLVLTWIALSWKIFGFSPIVTRSAMLLLAAFSLLGFFRLARTVSNATVAATATLVTAAYPVFFVQSSLAQVDLPAAGLIFWGLESYLRRKLWAMVVWFSLAALAKETAILIPLALLFWQRLSLILNNPHWVCHSEPASAREA